MQVYTTTDARIEKFAKFICSENISESSTSYALQRGQLFRIPRAYSIGPISGSEIAIDFIYACTTSPHAGLPDQ